MLQTTLCVPLEVKPESCARLTAMIDAFRLREDAGDRQYLDESGYPANFGRVAARIPVLHFMSMSVFTAADYDPLFILEANFDGPPGVFWGQLEAVFGDDLRKMLRCCKRPNNEDGPLYDAVTAEGAKGPVAGYLEARTQPPSVFHHGNRGLARDRILAEAQLFADARQELDAADAAGPSPYRAGGAAAAHQALRARLLPGHAWLDQPSPPRISGRERAMDMFRLLRFAVVVLLVLTAPAIALAALLPTKAYLFIILLATVPVLLLIYQKRKPLIGTGTPTSFSLPSFLWQNAPLILGYVAVATLVLIPLVWLAKQVLAELGAGAAAGIGETSWPVARAVSLGLFGLVFLLPLLVLWLRTLEMRDSSQEAPPVDEARVQEMLRLEDWIAQNHMGSIVLIKPGVLRTLIIRAGHYGLGLVLRVTATDGYLGSMRTVHFAHWAFLNNGSRLLFFSNFDQSWGSYLDDFIEKAHNGLTLAWGCGVGFPPTRFLVNDGASHGRRFKNWALASRAVSRFWYSAYPKLTVNQIERNWRIAEGLRKRRLSEKEAALWMQDL